MVMKYSSVTEEIASYHVGIISAPKASLKSGICESLLHDIREVADLCSFRTSKILSISEMSAGKYMFIITGESSDVTTCAYNMIMRLRRRFSVDFSISLSTAKRDMDHLMDAVCEALKVIGNSDGVMNTVVLYAEKSDRKVSLTNYFSSVTEYVELLTDAVINDAEPASIESIVSRLFENFKDMGITAEYARQICSDIFTCSASKLLNYFKDNKIITECLNNESMMDVSAHSMNKIREEFTNRYLHIQSILKTYFTYSAPVSSTIIETLNYLLKTQCSKVTLQYMADYLNVSSSYLSFSFKKKTGISFRDYVRRYKMDQAKFFLTHSQLTISQIAIQLGYNDIVNFSRIFKKAFGMPPSEYRNINRPADGAEE